MLEITVSYADGNSGLSVHVATTETGEKDCMPWRFFTDTRVDDPMATVNICTQFVHAKRSSK